MRLIVAALRSAATLLGIALYVAIVGPPVLLLAYAFRWPQLLYRAGLRGILLGFLLSGIRYQVEGREHIQRHRAAVYCINHSSNVEPPVIFAVLRDLFPGLRILYKAELRRLPILRTVFDVAGFVPLERANPDQSLPAVDRAADAVRSGASFLIFPEGTRSRTGELLPFKKGGFIMAIKAQAPVVPVAIVGARDAMRKGSPLIWPVVVSVRLGTPIETAGMTLADRDTLADEARRRVEELIRKGRIEHRDVTFGR